MTELIEGYSLEMTSKDAQTLVAAKSAIGAGREISITFLPNEQWDLRVGAAAAVRSAGMIPVPHISARRIASAAELDALLGSLSRRAAIDRVLVVAGDTETAAGPYQDALAVIHSDSLARHGIRKVGIAGYPEGHPSISGTRLWAALKEKLGALTARGHTCEIITQFSFDAEGILRWLVQLRQQSITAPVKIGIPGPAGAKSLLRYAARCGVSASARVMAKYGLSLTRLLSDTGPDALIEDLQANLKPELHGEVRLHVYPFGGFQRTAQWAHRFCASQRNRQVQASAAESIRASGV